MEIRHHTELTIQILLNRARREIKVKEHLRTCSEIQFIYDQYSRAETEIRKGCGGLKI